MTEYQQYEKEAELLKALAHPTRLCIVHGLMEREYNVSKIQACLELPQSTISQQLAILRKAGIIKGTRQGTEISYAVVNQKIKRIVDLLSKKDNGGE